MPAGRLSHHGDFPIQMGIPMASQIQHSRQIAFNRQDGKCYYCRLRMWFSGATGPTQLRCTAEHLIARSEGGSAALSNIVAACRHCNQTRHKRKNPPPPERYQAEVQRRIARGGWLPKHVRDWGGMTSPSANRAASWRRIIESSVSVARARKFEAGCSVPDFPMVEPDEALSY